MKARSEKNKGIFSALIEVIKLHHMVLLVKATTKRVGGVYKLFVTVTLTYATDTETGQN